MSVLGIEKLAAFVDTLGDYEFDFYDLAMGSFFGEMMDPLLEPETEEYDMDKVIGHIGEDCFNQLSICKTQFFIES